MTYVKGRNCPENFYNLLKELDATNRSFVLLETSLVRDGEDTTYIFKAPLDELVLSAGGDVTAYLRKAQQYIDDGYYLCGYIGYEMGYLLEPRLKGLAEKMMPAHPISWLGVFEAREAITHEKTGPAQRFEVMDIGSRMGEVSFDQSEANYIQAIERIKDYIRSGHTYQVNYTMRGWFDYDGAPTDLYQALRAMQPVPYGAFLKAGQVWVLSLSPELFFRIKDGIIVSRPMKGTTRRGRDLSEDAVLSGWLKHDEKNRAENIMIVDLIRNDIGRLSFPGSVDCPTLFEVERYETLFQMTSTVRGVIPASRCRDLKAVLKALFPCGSVTGAPKIRTMEIISELERSPRGVYCGAVGFFHREEAAFNVAIRTITLKDGRGEIGIGSGITMDSDPAGEYKECILKMEFIKRPYVDFALIETMLVDAKGCIHLLDEHMERLKNSAEYFGFPLDEEAFLALLDRECSTGYTGGARVAQGDDHNPFILRVTLNRFGDMDVEKRPLHAPPHEPIPVIISRERVDSEDRFLYHKTTRRELFDRELRRARSSGFYECLFLNERGELTQGSFTNLFIEKDGLLLTPALYSGLLPGTLRARLLKEGRAREAHIGPEDLRDAARIYIGNSVRGLLRVSIDFSRA